MPAVWLIWVYFFTKTGHDNALLYLDFDTVFIKTKPCIFHPRVYGYHCENPTEDNWNNLVNLIKDYNFQKERVSIFRTKKWSDSTLSAWNFNWGFYKFFWYNYFSGALAKSR